MRQGVVYYNDVVAGIISEMENGRYEFGYDDYYFSNSNLPAISVTLTKSKQQHYSKSLFPFFFNMLSEGANRKTQCRILKIDEEDDFGLLLKTGATETIGAITIEEINGT
ncbi:MAG: HipA N-terminal domain-containing protein [Gloeobacteraceae cyanobacterium ES-bin-316]|nr:HipA N-terminal domain-containing protein [Ferruginibacter sp.]